jgi:PAT family beta-lactamase induction signal transducer AmpG
MTSKRIAPVWLMGLTNATFGMYGGMVAISLPEILAEQHIPEARIAAITAVAMSPAFWAFLICPMLDVRFTRRFYAIASTLLAALCMAIGLFNVHRLALLELFLTLGFLSASITQNALGGWLSTAIHPHEESRLSAWFNVANIGGGGVIATFTLTLLHRLPLALASSLLGACLLLPMAIYPFIPVTPPDARLARESFAAFFREILALLKRREVLIALALFLAPSASFALTNILGGLGNDFHASARVVHSQPLAAATYSCRLRPLAHRRKHLPGPRLHRLLRHRVRDHRSEKPARRHHLLGPECRLLFSRRLHADHRRPRLQLAWRDRQLSGGRPHRHFRLHPSRLDAEIRAPTQPGYPWA